MALRQITDYLIAFGLLKPDAAEPVIDAYAAVLFEMPDDLLPVAVSRLTAEWKWGRLPLPADLTKTVADEIARRQTTALRLRTAEIVAQRNCVSR